jgi:hypothetical protein
MLAAKRAKYDIRNPEMCPEAENGNNVFQEQERRNVSPLSVKLWRKDVQLSVTVG